MKAFYSNKSMPKEHRDKISAALAGKPKSAAHRESTRRAALLRDHKSYCGKNNSNWKGGITAINHGLRDAIQNTFEYRQWRSDVYMRDNFQCKRCGSSASGTLNAHHKKLFQQILDEHRVTTVEQAILCEELWNINNGMTLCLDCHKKRHKKPAGN
jgi:hypothetical protein